RRRQRRTRGRLVDGDRRQPRRARHAAPPRRHGRRPRQPHPSVLRARARDRDRPRCRGRSPRRTRQRDSRERARGANMTTTKQSHRAEERVEQTPRTAADLVMNRLGDDRIGIRFEDDDYTWDDFARAAIRCSHFLAAHLNDRLPPHLGILLENRPEFLFWWAGSALSGTALVCMNPTRRGQELADDVLATDCQILLVDSTTRGLIDESDLPDVEVIDIDSD